MLSPSPPGSHHPRLSVRSKGQIRLRHRFFHAIVPMIPVPPANVKGDFPDVCPGSSAHWTGVPVNARSTAHPPVTLRVPEAVEKPCHCPEQRTLPRQSPGFSTVYPGDSHTSLRFGMTAIWGDFFDAHCSVFPFRRGIRSVGIDKNRKGKYH